MLFWSNLREQNLKIDFTDKISLIQFGYDLVEALTWATHYYHFGCQSWKWFFPHHYTIFPTEFCEALSAIILDPTDVHSDLKNPVLFDLGIPFRPFEQLAAVLPPLSFQLLPSIYHPILMSPAISDFYPHQLVIDLSQGVAERACVELPFIDEKKLLDVVEPLHSQLSIEEQKRNTNRNESLLLVSNIFFTQ